MDNLLNIFNKFPQVRLLHGPSKIEKLERLSQLLGGPQIFVKRDDQNEIGGGGNKLRKLEFLLGDAKNNNADTIMTVGARQSNHARLTAAAATRLGLACELLLIQRVARTDPDYLCNGNVVLDKIFGCKIHDLALDCDASAFALQRTQELELQNRRAYLIPTGGSNPIGALGYVRCAFEIAQQAAEQHIFFNHIVLPNGSAGTQAGLIVGCKLLNWASDSVHGFSVVYPTAKAAAQTLELAQATMQLLQSDVHLAAENIIIDDSQLGPDYGVPTPSMVEAVQLLARTEGLLLDPVYGGKAFAGLIAGIRAGHYKKQHNILFLMTGGLPGIFAYRSVFDGH